METLRTRGRLAPLAAAPVLVGVLLVVVLAGCGSSGGAGATATPRLTGAAATIARVDQACVAIGRNRIATFKAIDAGAPPWRDPADPGGYVFVYDKDVKVVATPVAADRGKDLSRVKDETGRRFRALIVHNALKGGPGWVTWVYKKPGEKGLHLRTTYYQSVLGSDGVQYVVCSERDMGSYTPPAP